MIVVIMETKRQIHELSRRVPRFVEEYAKDRNGTQAAIRAGYSPNGAHVTACRLLNDPKVVALVEDEMKRTSAKCGVDAEYILKQWQALADADPARIVHVRNLNCRHCWGAGHEYQWSAREHAQKMDAAMRMGRDLPDCSGGFGWVFNAAPNPVCPECQGEGVQNVRIADMETLTGPERRLIAGVKTTKEGIEIKFRDQDAAVKNLAIHNGMLIEKKEHTGKNGQPLFPAVPVPADLPTDPKELGAAYSGIVGE